MRLYELQNVKKYYGQLVALDIPSLFLDEGNFYIIYGPNGAGKTTLLKLLASLDKPSEGEIFFLPQAKDMTLVMQNPYLFKTTVLKNISFGLTLRSISKTEIEKKVSSIMRRLGIWEIRERNASLLSEGEKRKVALARALVLDKKVLLLDEPTQQLDKLYLNLIEELISSFAQDNKKSIIMTTHDLTQAHRLTSNIIYLLNGKVINMPLWNMFRVNLIGSNNLKITELSLNTKIYVATKSIGPTSIAINPKNIIVSRNSLRSSALNNLKGKIIGINEVDGLIDLLVDVGMSLHAFITHKSFYDMHLKIGEEIFVSFKASAVEVL